MTITEAPEDSTETPGAVGPAVVTATGHVVGWTYFCAHADMAYEVLGPATLWELAPHAAVRVRWANGNETLSTRPAGADTVVEGQGRAHLTAPPDRAA
jgi:hypothetical protein